MIIARVSEIFWPQNFHEWDKILLDVAENFIHPSKYSMINFWKFAVSCDS